jgi:hypothetical protein
MGWWSVSQVSLYKNLGGTETDRLNRRNIDMLDAFARLQVCIDLCGGGSCPDVSSDLRFRPECQDLPAAAAGSTGVFLASCDAGNLESMGLRLLLGSECRVEGERDRRSNREGFRGSGSV